jgi:hypothetical protein
MLKMRLPIEAVTHAMKRDGKDPTIIDLHPKKSLKSQQQEQRHSESSSSDEPALKEDPEYQKVRPIWSGHCGKCFYVFLTMTIIVVLQNESNGIASGRCEARNETRREGSDNNGLGSGEKFEIPTRTRSIPF